MPQFSFLAATPVLFLLTTAPQFATASPVPGLAEGAIDGVPFSVPLECDGWSAEQRMVYSAGDDRARDDVNGDGVVLSFSHFAPASMTNGTLIIDGRELMLNAGFNPGPDAGSWDVTDDGAVFTGQTSGVDSANVRVAIDCAPRPASERGFTGRVTGVIDGTTIDQALYCGNWENNGATQANTEENVDPKVELFVMQHNGQGSVEVDTAGQTYQIVVAPIAGTEFGITEDEVTLTADLTRRSDDYRYSVDLTFNCEDR